MNNIDKIVEDLIQLGKPEVRKIQQSLNAFYVKNTSEFLRSVIKEDVQAAQNYLKQGINWNNPDTWHTLYSQWKGAESSLDISLFIYNLEPDELFLSDRATDRDILKEMQKMNKLKFKFFCDEKLKQNLNSGLFSTPTNNHVLRYFYFLPSSPFQKPKEQMPPNYLIGFCNALSKNEMIGNKDIVEKIIHHFPETIDMFVNNPQYESDLGMIKEMLEKNSNLWDNREKLMDDAIGVGNLLKIKLLSELGVGFPTTKKAYSELFSSIKRTEAIDYIIENIPDITVGADVILKTVLHYNYESLIEKILDQYPENSSERLKLLIKDREKSSSVDKVEKYILMSHLSQKLPVNTNSIKIKI